MKDYINKFKEKLLSHTEGKKGEWWLGVLSFAESSFFPIPPDFFLIPIVAKEPNSWIRKATITTITSIVGGLFGYLIGFFLFNTIGQWMVNTYHLENELIKVGQMFNDNAFLAIFTAAFTPIPYKLFTIAGGLFKIDIIPFIIASILGRGGRFFIVSYISKVFGKWIGQDELLKYFNILTGILALIIIVFLVLSFI